MNYFRFFPSSTQEHLIYYSDIAFTCLNYCRLGKQIMASKSKCCEILKLIRSFTGKRSVSVISVDLNGIGGSNLFICVSL